MNNNDIKTIRIKMNLTQEEFGNLLGVTRRTLINYEKGTQEPNNSKLLHIKSIIDENKNSELSITTPIYKKVNNQPANNESIETKYIKLLEQENKTLKEIINELEKKIAT